MWYTIIEVFPNISGFKTQQETNSYVLDKFKTILKDRLLPMLYYVYSLVIIVKINVIN